MNIQNQNPAVNGLRGVLGDSLYLEYIQLNDATWYATNSARIRDAIAAVRGRVHPAEQSVGLYPTTGTSDDYVFSRHVVDPTKRRVRGMVIETGTEFQHLPGRFTMFAHHLPLCLLALLFLAVGAWGAPPEPANAAGDVERLAREAKFIFKGTVQKLHAATLSSVPITDHTIIVRVDELLDAPKEFAHYAGKDITVQLSQPKSMTVGQQAVFFTNGAVYGKSIAVREVGRIDAAAKE